MTEEILARVMQLRGEEGDRETLFPICAAVETELAGRLKQGVSPADCGEAFLLAAACQVLAFLAAAGWQEQVESFTAGDVTIRHSGETAAQRSQALRRQAEQLLAPWVEDGRFFFQKVMG